jgi:hypothetical protein
MRQHPTDLINVTTVRTEVSSPVDQVENTDGFLYSNSTILPMDQDAWSIGICLQSCDHAVPRTNSALPREQEQKSYSAASAPQCRTEFIQFTMKQPCITGRLEMSCDVQMRPDLDTSWRVALSDNRKTRPFYSTCSRPLPRPARPLPRYASRLYCSYSLAALSQRIASM